MYCPEVLCAHVRALLLHRSLDGSYFCFVFSSQVSFPRNSVFSLCLCCVSPNKHPRLSLSPLAVKRFEGISGFFFFSF